MIDEIRLAEKSKWIVELTEGEYGKGWNDCNKHWIEVIKKMPKVGEWIPCSERLPEELVPVNVTWVNRNPSFYYKDIKDKPFTATAIYHRGIWHWWSSTVEDILAEYGHYIDAETDKGIDIIAWMPLPEPYKAGDPE